MVLPAAPAPSGLVQPPPRSLPNSVPEGGGLKDYGLRPVGTGGTAQRGFAGGLDATIAGGGGGRLGTRAGALTCHRRPPSLSGGVLLLPIATLRLIPLLVFLAAAAAAAPAATP